MRNSLTLGSSVQVYRAKMDPVCFSQIKHQRADVQLYVYIWTFAVTVVDSRLPTHPLYIIVFFMTVSGKPKKSHLIWRWSASVQLIWLSTENESRLRWIYQAKRFCVWKDLLFFSVKAPWHLLLHTGTLTAPLGGIIVIQILRHHTDIMHYFGLDNCFF